MNKNLEALTNQLKVKSAEHLNHLDEMLKHAFDAHLNDIKNLLSENQKHTNSVIEQQQTQIISQYADTLAKAKSMNQTTTALLGKVEKTGERIAIIQIKTWLITVFLVVVTILAAFGLITWQNAKIKANSQIISKQNANIKLMNGMGGNIHHTSCLDKKNQPRLCIQIDQSKPIYQGGYMIPKED